MLVSQSCLELNHSVLISRFVHCACWNMYRLAEKVGQGEVGGFTHRVKSALVLMVGITAAEYMGWFAPLHK